MPSAAELDASDACPPIRVLWLAPTARYMYRRVSLIAIYSSCCLLNWIQDFLLSIRKSMLTSEGALEVKDHRAWHVLNIALQLATLDEASLACNAIYLHAPCW